MSLYLPFPRRNATIRGLPNSLQNLGDFELSIQWLKRILPRRRLPNIGKAGNVSRPSWMQFQAITLFYELCNDVCSEMAANEESGKFKIHKTRYARVRGLLRSCIEKMKKCGKMLKADMTFLLGVDKEYDRYYPGNWYKLVYDDLMSVERVLTRFIPDVPDDVECAGFATFLFHRTGFEAPAKNKKDDWAKVLKEYGFDGTWTPLTLGQIYNRLVNESNRLNPKSDKNLKDAVLLFKLFPDKEGFKKLQKEIEKQKKGTVPE